MQRGSDFISLIEYVFPPRCVFCNEILTAGVPIYICGKCAKKIGYYNNCINSLNLPGNMETYCDGMICVGRYSGGLKSSLKRFKFNSKPSYYRAFGKLLALKVQNTIHSEKIDMVVPVPLYRYKQKLRGYNQAELIAKYAAEQLKLPFAGGVLVKTSESKSQSALNRNERLINVEGLFKVIKAESISDKNILLVDDIITTGSTVNQSSKALKLAGASRIIAGVIATTRNY
ncbi:ComF family protein [Ruminiclostridium sufflavum]|uniref:ComF family protein n=1 Tax=Ruminiclostridium sufflavum TaxID=396504 RepID=UPI001FA8E898|nr:ComF family protein [Ruminiclostridium sufflavum]